MIQEILSTFFGGEAASVHGFVRDENLDAFHPNLDPNLSLLPEIDHWQYIAAYRLRGEPTYVWRCNHKYVVTDADGIPMPISVSSLNLSHEL